MCSPLAGLAGGKLSAKTALLGLAGSQLLKGDKKKSAADDFKRAGPTTTPGFNPNAPAPRF